MSSVHRSFRRRIFVPAVLLASTIAAGTCGYHYLWADDGGTWMDALFMSFTTVTTIGFGEVRPLTTAGRTLTMLVATFGIGSLFYSFSVVMDYLVSDQLQGERRRRRMQKTIDGLKDHYLVAGLGRVGREVTLELMSAKASFVVIDPSDEGEKFAEERRMLFLKGDASEDEVLMRAGIERAKGLVVTTPNDATNLSVILSARLLNANLFIASRAVDTISVPKLTRVGANRVISPYAIGGKRLAHLMLSPRVVDFFETALQKGNQSLNIGDIIIAPNAHAAGKALGDLKIPQETGATLLCVLKEGSTVATPRGDLVLVAGDHVLALGTGPQLEKLELLIGR